MVGRAQCRVLKTQKAEPSSSIENSQEITMADVADEKSKSKEASEGC